MSENYRFDAHCHIFTMKYAIKEVKSMVHDILVGTYPWKDPSLKSLSKGGFDWHDIKELLKQLHETIHAAGGSEEENLQFLQKEAKKVFPSDEYKIIPLMMDVFYMFAYSLEKDQDVPVLPTLKSASVDEQLFQESWNEILDDFKDYLQSQKRKSVNLDQTDLKIEDTLLLIEKERPVSVNKFKALASPASSGYYKTQGFSYHLEKLMDLVGSKKGQLYPFIAIDPRRPGMIDALLSGAFFTGEKRFYGVKLYPRMGYHPQSKPMDAIYKYCSDHGLPITFHCGRKGFPPVSPEKWKYSDFGNPLNFEPIVKKYPNLKIDFAHMGSGEPTLEWAKTIARLVNENENVYTDLSCYTDPNDLIPIKVFMDNNPKLITRLMFGTDFDVMYFTALVNMGAYFSSFQKNFTSNELEVMMHDNPKRFLGI